MMSKNALLLLSSILLLLGCAGCQSIKKFLNPDPTPEEIRRRAERKNEYRSPTDVLPFKAKQSSAPSLYDSTLSEREREALRGFRSEGDRMLIPGESKESKAARGWVFGY